MFEYIRGSYQGIFAGNAVIECGGVGWSLCLSARDAALLEASAGGEALLFTHHLQREDAQELYGFITREERALFRKLMTVSGIGPKQAIRILGSAQPAGIVQAILHENAALLSGIPGLGAKTAQKLVFELKGKMDDFLHLWAAHPEDAGDTDESGGNRKIGQAKSAYTPGAPGGQAAGDCYAALQALGYAPAEARAALAEALKESAPGETAEELIKRALRYVK